MTQDEPQGPSWETIPDTGIQGEPDPQPEETPEDENPEEEGDEEYDGDEDKEEPPSPEAPRKYAKLFDTPEDLEKAYVAAQRKISEQGEALGQARRGEQPSQDQPTFEPHKLGSDGNYRDELGVVYYKPDQWRSFARERLAPAFTDPDTGEVDTVGLTIALTEAKEQDRDRYNEERQAAILRRESGFQRETARIRSGYAPRVEKVLGSKEAADDLFARIEAEFKRQPPEIRTDPNAYTIATAAALGLRLMGLDPESLDGQGELADAVEERTVPRRGNPPPSTRPGGGSARRKTGKVPDAYKAAVARGELSAQDAIEYGSDSYILET